MLNSSGCAACEGRASFFCVLRRVLIARLIKSSGRRRKCTEKPEKRPKRYLFIRTNKKTFA